MTLRDWVKSGAKAVVGTAIGAGWPRPLESVALGGRVKIVYAHYFGPPRPYLPRSMPISLERLRALLKRIREHFEFAPLDAVIEAGCGKEPSLRNAVALTLDDGYDILREGAYEPFEEFKVPVTTFVVVDAIENRNLLWPNKLRAIEAAKGRSVFRAKLAGLQHSLGYGSRGISRTDVSLAGLGWPASRKDALADDLWRACDMPNVAEYLDEHRPYHTLAQLRDLIRRGHQVGLHTRTHPYCDRLTPDEVESEFVYAAAWLKRELQIPALPMAYPFGVRLPDVLERRLAEEAGVTCALGVSGFSMRPTTPMQLKRVSLEGDFELNVFAALLKNGKREPA